MALKIKDEEIVGTIDNLQEKLEGKLPIDRLELLYLINSWGRIGFFYTEYLDEGVKIGNCRLKECYDLSRLDTSQIKNMDDVFIYSLFEGDISQWNTSNVTSMDSMFKRTTKFNGDISNWDVSNVTSMNRMFYGVDKFNSDINKWVVSNVTSMNRMFCNANKFNSNIEKWDVSA